MLSRVRPGVLALLRALANTGQIFPADTRVLPRRQGHDVCADDVVEVRHDAPFPAFQLLDRPKLPKLLQPLPSLRIHLANMPDALKLVEDDGAIRRCDRSRNILPPINPQPAARDFCAGNVHRHGNAGVPDAFAGSQELDASSLGATFQQRIQPILMRSDMHFDRDASLGAAQQTERDRVGFSNLVQGPILVASAGVGVADGLIDPGRTDFGTARSALVTVVLISCSRANPFALVWFRR